jgi:hypothetical protein
MATRLEITHGLIAERDRLSTSADTLSVIRPTTGSKTRSKGVLFVLVSSTLPGPRTREATRLVADTIQHEYYYDESAGVPVCLEKAVKSADRRLRNSREGVGLSPGSLGVAVAVIRNNEIYLATLGAAEAYLVRSARLLMPDRGAPAGLPSDESRSVDVWRGELSVGDGLLLVSRNLTETVGTEELKSAILTLHPQAAVNHLHHLFVAAGGTGSDGLIAVEAKEQTTRVQGRAGAAADAYGDLPGVAPEALGGSVGSTLLGARGAVDGVRDRFWNAMPKRRTKAHDVSATTSRAENQRRAAMGLLALVVVVFVAGLVLVLVPRGSDVTEVDQVAGSDSALASALDSADRADNLLSTEPETAKDYYREAWAEVKQARSTGLSAPALDQLETRVRNGLDSLYGVHTPAIEKITGLRKNHDPAGLVRGPRGGAVYIDRESGTVMRVNLKNGKTADIVHEGDKQKGTDRTIEKPAQLAAAGPDVVIVDDTARPWRWRPSNSAGAGTLARLTLQGRANFESDHGDVEAYDGVGDYRMYVAEPSLNQVMRYQQTLDGSAFSEPSPYLASQTAEVADFDQIYIDFDVYALFDNSLRRHTFGKYDGTFMLDEPPDGSDLRPGHDYQIVDGSGRALSNGRAYLYDALHGRVVGFNKASGEYIGQWLPGDGGTEMDDMRGMYVIEGAVTKKGKRKDDTLVWVTPTGIFRAVLPLD